MTDAITFDPFRVIPYTPEDWYWVIGGDAANVYSSKRVATVPASDPDFLDWSAGKYPSSIPSMEELEEVLRPIYPAGTLNTYNADARHRKAAGGIVCQGVDFPSDTLTMGALNSAYIYTQQKANATFEWKLADGSFVTLNKNQIAAIQTAQNDFDQACFACESENAENIDAGTITTLAQIDAAFAAISNVFPVAAMEGVKVRKRRHG